MLKKHLPILIGIGLAIAILLLILPGQQTVTILVEGQPVEVTTSARRVADVLADAGFPLNQGDEVSPGPNSIVRNGETISLTQASLVSIHVNGETETFTSTERSPGLWFEQAGVILSEEDRILVNGQQVDPAGKVPYSARISVEVRRAVKISLTRAGETWQISSSAPTLGRALWDAGFLLTPSDLLTPSPETPLEQEINAVWVPGKQIRVEVDGEIFSTATSAGTVGEALAQTGFPLQGLDYSIPAEEAPLPADGAIQIVRVTEEVVIIEETIPFQTQFQLLEDVEIDNYKVSQLGQVGITAKRERVRYEDGAEVSRIVEDQWVLREPVDRIEGYGTKIVVRTEMTPDGPIEYWRKVSMYATSYSPCNSAADRCYPYTSIGLPVERGVVAVIYDWYIPMGNHTVYVPGYGHAIIADVGGGIPGRHWIDLGYSDEDYVPWAQWVTVYFTTPIPPAHEILYVLPYK
ncbi:MAG: DUF348 domain-containing protein [Anaerolineales bacterium]|nr:DUF348 domain-containing protein [Anaerolineales bacterium]